MSKSSHFFGQPVYGQLIKSLDREKLLKLAANTTGKGMSRALMDIHIC